MKNVLKVLGIIALVAVIGFGVAACKSDDDDSGGGGSKLPGSLQKATYTNSSGDKLEFGTKDVKVTTGGETKTFNLVSYEANEGMLSFDNKHDDVITLKNGTPDMVKLNFPSGQKYLMGPWTKE